MFTTTLTPARMADRTGVTIDTLRYDEREGLLQNVARADSGHRRYSDDDALWVEVRCHRYGIGMIPYSPLGGGLLTGKYRRDQPLPESVRADENAEARFSDANWAIIETLVDVAEREGQTPAQAAIDWLRSKPWVSAPIVGANRPDQLRATIAGLDTRLSPEAITRLDEVSSFRRGRTSLET